MKPIDKRFFEKSSEIMLLFFMLGGIFPIEKFFIPDLTPPGLDSLETFLDEKVF